MTPVPPGLDLAFSCDEALSAAQVEAAGPLPDPATALAELRNDLTKAACAVEPASGD